MCIFQFHSIHSLRASLFLSSISMKYQLNLIKIIKKFTILYTSEINWFSCGFHKKKRKIYYLIQLLVTIQLQFRLNMSSSFRFQLFNLRILFFTNCSTIFKHFIDSIAYLYIYIRCSSECECYSIINLICMNDVNKMCTFHQKLIK